MITDADGVAKITQLAERGGLTLDKQQRSGKFCTGYLEAPAVLTYQRQAGLLRHAKDQLLALGIEGAELTHFDNPPYRSKSTGKMEPGHPRHGDPLLIIESVWWE